MRLLYPSEIRPDPFGREVENSVDRSTLRLLREVSSDPQYVREEWRGRTWMRVDTRGPGRRWGQDGPEWATRLGRLEQLGLWRPDGDPAWGWVVLPED